MAEKNTECVVDRALLKALHAKKNGDLPAAEYYKIAEKVDSLKKLKFVEGYEYHQDVEIYEWMKYKVASEVGG